MTVMSDLFLYGTPWVFFFLAFYFRLKSNAIPFFQKNNLKFDPKKNVFGITIRTMNEAIKRTEDKTVITELRRIIRIRKLHFTLLILILLWTLFLGVVTN